MLVFWRVVRGINHGGCSGEYSGNIRWDIQQTDVWLCPELGYPKCATWEFET